MSTRFVEIEQGREMRYYPVPGFEGRYEFNAAGSVRSLDRYVNSPAAGGRRIVRGTSIVVRLVKGYPAFCASKGGKKATVYLHRCIASALVPNPHRKPDVNHIDGDKANFAPENLEWCTQLENMRHAFATGLTPLPKSGPGEKSPAAKLTAHQVSEIRGRIRSGERRRAVADMYGVSLSNIHEIARGATWKDVA